MAIRLTCPAFDADPTVIGHGSAEGYSTGGALSHGSRCNDMGDVLRARGIAVVTTAAKGRGPQTEDEFFTAAAAKFAATSAPVAPAPAGETVVIDGKVYRAE